MIPKNINIEHILKAISFINENGIPKNRFSRNYILQYENIDYPPKYVFTIANKFINGSELNSDNFNAVEAKDYLLRLDCEDFKIYKNGDLLSIAKKNILAKRSSMKDIDTILGGINQQSKVFLPKRISKNKKHNERCKLCKERVYELLKKNFGNVEENYKINMTVYPDQFKDTKYYQKIKNIYQSLQKYRGHEQFTRTENLSRVDYFIPNPGFIVEFDESQHFTKPRDIALSNYPEDVGFAFDIDKWKLLSRKFNKRDNDPPFRDEQRAWYDTLRDFAPLLLGLEPTVRIFAQDFKWCDLYPNIQEDNETFKKLLEGKSVSKREISIIQDENPSIARIIYCGNWNGSIENCTKVINQTLDHWPKDLKVEFLQTWGAFIEFNWPSELKIKNNKEPDGRVVNILIDAAEKSLKNVFTEDQLVKLKKITKYISIGVDSRKSKISISGNSIKEKHIELVCLIDLENNKYYWSGKSYPTVGQEDGLIRITNLESHFVKLKKYNVMLLGCHDLNMFNNRGKAVGVSGEEVSSISLEN